MRQLMLRWSKENWEKLGVIVLTFFLVIYTAKLACISQNTFKFIQESDRSEHRPWINVTHIERMPDNRSARVVIQNFGNAPAICIQGQMNSEIVPDSLSDSDFIFANEGEQSIGMTAPTESLYTFVPIRLTPSDTTKIHNKGLRLFVFGRITYKAPWESAATDTTEFSQYWNGAGWIEGQSHNTMK